jgi:photosynthetic reaction center cytochrome c subunit
MLLKRGTIACVAGLMVAGLLGTTLARGQAGPAGQAEQKPLLSEQAFKNVQLLRGIPVKEFMETMGFFCASLAMTCTDCHGGASASSWANYADDPPLKQTARRMVLMVNAINSANFNGERSVTCFTCHRGSPRPKVIPSLAQQYAVPPEEDPDEIEIFPGTRSARTAEQILDRYIQAVGGAANAAKLTSYTGKGTYEGFDSDFDQVPVDVYAKAPNMRATVVHMHAGQSSNIYDGRQAWSSGAQDLVPVPVVALVDHSLEGARLDAELAFPGRIKQMLTNWQTGFPPVSIDGRSMDVVQGEIPGGSRIKLYFDSQTGLLVRYVRYSVTAVGTVPIHVSYTDYREVPGVGVKIPYEWEVTWTDGKSTYKLDSVQPNVAIDASRFAKPAPLRAAATQ